MHNGVIVFGEPYVVAAHGIRFVERLDRIREKQYLGFAI